LLPTPDPDHHCDWRDEAIEAIAERDRLRAENEALKRQLQGHKSEKMPPMDREVRRDADDTAAEARRKRKERAVAKTRLVTETVESKVPDDQRKCPKCGREDLKAVGEGKPSTIYEYVPGYFRRRICRRETLACACAYSGRTRALIPETLGHRFRAHLGTCSGHLGADSGALGH
jgi:hypothetical protein